MATLVDRGRRAIGWPKYSDGYGPMIRVGVPLSINAFSDFVRIIVGGSLVNGISNSRPQVLLHWFLLAATGIAVHCMTAFFGFRGALTKEIIVLMVCVYTTAWTICYSTAVALSLIGSNKANFLVFTAAWGGLLVASECIQQTPSMKPLPIETQRNR